MAHSSQREFASLRADGEQAGGTTRSPAAEDVARIGPNAIVRTGEALDGLYGPGAARRIFASAGLAHYVVRSPEAMVDEREVLRLHRTVRRELDREHARAVLRDAGKRTGDYLLAHRIPRPVQRLLRLLPAGLATRVLLGAIRRNAWTFVGSGRFEATTGRVVTLTIQGNPLCRGEVDDETICHYYAATFERLFRSLVHPGARVIEIECEAQGVSACRFEIRMRDT